MENTIATTSYLVPAAAVQVFPDSARYKCRFTVRSSSSNQLHMVSYDTAGYWTCSCRGNIRHGSCKHLESMGLKGRKYGLSRLEDAIKIQAPNLTLAYAA